MAGALPKGSLKGRPVPLRGCYSQRSEESRLTHCLWTARPGAAKGLALPAASAPPEKSRTPRRPVDSRPARAHNGLTMICRIWHGWTIPADAEAYEALLKGEILVGIQDRRIAGFRGIQLLRRSLGDEVEFVTIMWFDSMEAVRAFAGEAYENAVVPPNARLLLSRFDERSHHYEVKTDMVD